MATWILAKKELRLLLRDYRALVILLAMPLIFILVLGVSVGEGFGKKPDDRLRVSVVNLDEGLPPNTPANLQPPDARTWAEVVLKDLSETASIRVEIIDSPEKAKELVDSSQRAAVLVLGKDFSKRVSSCSFLEGGPPGFEGINPFHRDGVTLSKVDIIVLKDPTQPSASSIIDQVAQGSMLRIVLPWMIGKAFEELGEEEFIRKLGRTMEVPIFAGAKPVKLEQVLTTAQQRRAVGKGVQAAIKEQFSRYDLTAKTWDALTKSQGTGGFKAYAAVVGGAALAQAVPGGGAGVQHYADEGSGLLKLGSQRYTFLVPSYTVMFAFFLVLTIGWLFVAERRQGTLKRLCIAPITRAEILFGKLVPCYLLSVVQGLFLLLAGKLIFQMSWGSEPWWLVPVVLATSLAAMGMGVLIAGVARTEAQVAIYGSLVVLVLAGLSGCLMGNRALMPEAMQHLSRITPHAWALDAYLQLLTNPQPNVAVVAQACGVLVLFGAGFLVLAWRFMRLD
jgi:ABC-type multidrug transport system permease subunit